MRFRPFLTGERGGVAGPDERGGWSGLQPGTTRADLARAAVEGVVFAVGAAADLLDVRDVVRRSSSPAVVRAPASSSSWSPTCCGGPSATSGCAARRRSAPPCWPGAASGSTSSRGGDRPADRSSRAPDCRPPSSGGGRDQSSAGRRTRSRAASCSAPLLARALPPLGPVARQVGEPTAGLAHDHVEGGRSQTDTSGSVATSTAPSATST